MSFLFCMFGAIAVIVMCNIIIFRWNVKMKRRVICFLMVCIFTASTTQPFVSVDAAELWNKGSQSKKGGKTYYNNRKLSPNNSSSTLYNHKGISSNNKKTSISRKTSRSGYGLYREVRMSKQKPSKQWKRMSSTAVSNRQSDVEFALKQEYRILIDVAKKMNVETKKQQKQRYKDQKKYEKRIAQYKRDQAQAKIDEQVQRDEAYARLVGKKGWRKRKASKDRGHSAAVRGDTGGVKKSTKLFNDLH